MGAIGGMLGTAGGASGTGVDGPAGANIMSTVGSNQIAGADQQMNMNLQGQDKLLAALQGQGGLGKQTDVYGQLQGVANGTGPNPAQAQYQKNVQDLARQQSGAISSIQGISPALAARMISQQGSAAMQNAAGQGGANLANQQLGALSQAGGMANTMAGNEIGQTNANTQARQAYYNSLLGAAANQNNANVASQSSINSANASMANTGMQGQQGFVGGLMNMVGGGGASIPGGGGGGGGAGAAAMAAAGGGEVVKMADGGNVFGPQSQFGRYLAGGQSVQVAPPVMTPISVTPAVSSFQKGLGGAGGTDNLKGKGKSQPQPQAEGYGPMGGGAGDAPASGGTMRAAGGGRVSALVSPGEQWLPPKAVQQVMSGKNPLSAGERIPGKPKVAGNSYANDVVPKKLEAGGIVIPNSIMQSKDPAKGARDFVANIIAKRRARG